MRSFMRSGAHRGVMPRLAKWCDEAALAHWVQDGPEPPSWQEAYQRLQQHGRRSRVDHPSDAQRRFEIPAPRPRGVTTRAARNERVAPALQTRQPRLIGLPLRQGWPRLCVT